MVDTLNSSIVVAGTRFVVNDRTEDSTIAPGSTGFISYIRGRDDDYHNVAYLRTIITRRGKNGKHRIDMVDLSTPIFDIAGDAEVSRIMPEEKRKYYVHINVPNETIKEDVLEYSDIDYLAWGCAYASYVQTLCQKATHINPWPTKGNDLLNVISNIMSIYSENPEAALIKAAIEERETFIQRLRMVELAVADCAIQYMTRIAKIEETAIKEIKTYCKNIGTTNIVKNTIDLFTFKCKQLNDIAKNKPKRKG